MRVFRSLAEVDLPWGTPIGFVPTMGALHDGHLHLMRTAKQECGYAVASVFVNPTQFGPSEDFNAYPRNEGRDFELARSAGVGAMFAPSVDEMHPQSATTVHVSGVSDRWEGEHRPGHFDGVATVVSKLFNIIRPTCAYFGWKDFQQCAVIQRMVVDLNIPVELRFMETLREADGLAMSSRNAYLTVDERQVAPMMHQVITVVRDAILRDSEVDPNLNNGIRHLRSAGFDVDYLACVDEATLEPVKRITGPSRVIVAAKLGNTRLIDNVPLHLA